MTRQSERKRIIGIATKPLMAKMLSSKMRHSSKIPIFQIQHLHLRNVTEIERIDAMIIETAVRDLREIIASRERDLREIIASREKDLREIIASREKDLRETIASREKDLRESIASRGKDLRETIASRGKDLRETETTTQVAIKNNIK